MTQVKMPESVALVVSDFAIFWAGSGPIAPLVERNDVRVGSQLITTEQAEAYAKARVREALEDAITAVLKSQSKYEAESRIIRLIPKEST